MIRTEGIDHVALAVRDVERSAAWYCELLGLRRMHQGVWGSFPAVVGTESTAVALFPVNAENPQSAPGREALVMLHLAFRVSRRDFEIAQVALADRGIAFDFQDHEISHSLYFSDPDGHRLELTTYEVGAL